MGRAMNDNLCGHYTTLSGLHGILESGRLWASNVSFMNDESEFKHAIDLVLEILPMLKQTLSGDNVREYEYFIKSVNDNLIESISDYSRFVFVASFSREVDLLSQWRGYCRDSNGYNLLIDATEVIGRIFGTGVNIKLVDCIYDDSTKRWMIQNILMNHFNEFRLTKSMSDYDMLINEMAQSLLSICPCFKHSSYSEENEVRAIVIEEGYDFEGLENGNVKYRKGQYCLIPYYELPLEKSDIKGIIVGPNQNQELSKKSLLMFAKSRGWIDVVDKSIRFSSIPYRSL